MSFPSSWLPALFALFATAYPSLCVGTAPTVSPVIGSTVESFELRSCYGRMVSLDEFPAPVVVIAILGTECPLARHYARRLANIQTRFQGDVAVVGIVPNVQDTPQEITRFRERQELNFPLLVDRNAQWADRLQARRTPEVFLLDAQRRIRYRGRVDDQYDVGAQRQSARHHDLELAIRQVLSHKTVENPETEAVGCHIGRPNPTAPSGDITYYDHVAEVLERHCVQCHRRGQIAPFPLESYDDTIGWGPTILEAVGDGRMPPWFADCRPGAFLNDTRLSAADEETLTAWIRNGMPKGEPRETTRKRAAVGWQIGAPDQVLSIHPEPFTVPATGPIDYEYLDIDPGWSEDTYVSAVEIRPGNPAVVHHIVVYCWGPLGTKRMLAAFAPGCPPSQERKGYAQLCDAGSTLKVVVHYTPTGRPEVDDSKIALRMLPRHKVNHVIQYLRSVEYDFAIPPHADEYTVTAESRVPRDCVLVSMMPHMHLRGKSFTYEALYPSGAIERLLHIPQYDFNWQLRYVLSTPRSLPQGTRIRCRATYDNSEWNPVNPDPNQEVRFGLRTTDEMMFGIYELAYRRIQAPEVPPYEPNWSECWPPWTVPLCGALLTVGIAAVMLRRSRPSKTLQE